MKYLFPLLILCSVCNASTVRSVRLERIYDSQGVFLKVTVSAYVTDSSQDGTPYIRDLTTAGQLNHLADVVDLTAFQLSKMPDRVWIFYNDDGTIDRVNHQIRAPFSDKVTIGSNVPSQLVAGIQNLKTYIEGLLP